MPKKIKKVLKLDQNKEYKIVAAEEQKKKQLQFFGLGMATEIGYSIAVPVVLGALIGVWLDIRFQSKPKFTLSGIFTGIFLSFVNLYKIVQNITRKSKS